MPVLASIESLEWENRFFNIHSGIVRFSDSATPLSVAELAQFQRVQAKVPASRTDWLDGLQQLGFQLVEGDVDLALPVGVATPDPGLDVALEADIPALRQQAATVFAQSRFRAPWYAPDASGRFYAQWIENAVRGQFDNQCLVARADDGSIRGFVSMRQLSAQEARIGLLAGRGAGETLMLAARHWCEQRAISTLRVATQAGNTAALRRYIQSGATIESTAYWLYR